MKKAKSRLKQNGAQWVTIILDEYVPPKPKGTWVIIAAMYIFFTLSVAFFTFVMGVEQQQREIDRLESDRVLLWAEKICGGQLSAFTNEGGKLSAECGDIE